MALPINMNYGIEPDVAYKGQRATSQFFESETGICTVDMEPAIAVMVDEATTKAGRRNHIKEFDGTGPLAGVLLWTPARLEMTEDGKTIYRKGSMATVVVNGILWVEVDAAVKSGAPAYYSGGKFTETETGKPVGFFKSKTDGAGLAKLKIDLGMQYAVAAGA
ncbi:hypothetical protein vBYenM636_57 [Yersinia phage vB_YenM_636]|nr:hypothetical protein vBYenM12_57 [Yersinia phage vB_YenM_12]QKN86399.1 hypothetical protein vBYenM22_57 [Yersinia phage vB_YenM_22]QKN86490.1 hypothetical protein vBYenM25_57 [Yersinia phage vB_YenM_25]QKN86581.1 hypothetical protein vBYenM27_57 [Yersinia phage vB_YenM_27]QKN86672.1 hypothetical protein vBYenM39_57 [Yersinia phage vB_YenM_39]QKN86763.1 hypothetical protein vBYenM126_57 [Yersinia phage vB_YenM_126]QKN86854.1 hypothetical protein vBYenM526-1_57 [Yersinia phage vB_YenM_526-1]